MRISDFNNLPFDEKTNYLWDNGVCLNQRLVDNSFIVCIFEVDSFFVEAIYSRNNNSIDSIVPIIELKQWEGYVDCVILQLLSPS
jgi:hypothetical protein